VPAEQLEQLVMVPVVAEKEPAGQLEQLVDPELEE